MRFVSGAESVVGQNLVACQVNNQIYFYTVKPIMPDQELLVWYCKEFAERLNYSVNGELMEKKIRKSIVDHKNLISESNKNRLSVRMSVRQSPLGTVKLINFFHLIFPLFFRCLRHTGEQLLSTCRSDSSSSIQRESRRDSIDTDEMLMSAPCPSSLIKESLKHSITARLSLNHHQTSSEASPLENLSLAFGSSIAPKSATKDDSSSNLLSNVNNSHNNANSSGKFCQAALGSQGQSNFANSRSFD